MMVNYDYGSNEGRWHPVMEYLQSIAMEIAELDAVALQKKGLTPKERQLSDSAVRLIAALKGDLLHAAIGIAINGSVANSLARATLVDSPGQVFDTFSPGESSIFTYAAERLLDVVYDFELYHRLQHFNHMLSLAKRLSMHWTKSEDWSLVSDLSAAWAETCSAALELNKAFTIALRKSGEWNTLLAEARSLDLLAAIAQGKSPCVNRRGHVFVPEWLDRRARIRRSIKLAAQVFVSNVKYEAQLTDISTGGVGARIRGTFSVGTSARIVFSGLRTIDATVTWAVGSRVGLRFAVPLSIDDPLLHSGPETGGPKEIS